MDAMLLEVVVLDRGTQTSEEVAAGATTVPLEDVTQFDDTGVVSIDGTTYTYSAVTLDPTTDAGNLILDVPTVAAVDAGQPVSVVAGGQVVQDWTAACSLGEGDTVTVGIPFGLRASLPVGLYEPPVSVQVADDLSTLEEVPGRAPVLDGSMLDPATVPEPAPPTDPPAVSPALQAVGDSTGVTLVADGIDPTTWLDYYVDGVLTTETAGQHTRSTVVRLTLDSTGQPMQLDTTYTFHAVASNVAGSAAAGTDATARLATGVDAKVVLGWVAAGFVLAGGIQVGNITIDPDSGITIPLANGRQIVFPADGSDAQILAHLIAQSLDVLGQLNIRGTTNQIASGASVTLATGATPPSNPPGVESVLPGTTTNIPGVNPAGWAYYNGSWYFTQSFSGCILTRVSPSSYSWQGSITLDRSEVGSGLGGVTFVGNSAYFLCQTDEVIEGQGSVRWYVYKATLDDTSMTLTYNSRWVYEPTTYLGGYSDFVPSIGTTPTGGIVVAQCGPGGDLWLTTYDANGTFLQRTRPTTDGSTFYSPGGDIASIVWGTLDYAAAKIIITIGSRARVIDAATMQREAGSDFNAPDAVGLGWDGSLLKMRDADSAYTFTKLDASFFVASTWRRADATGPDFAQYETTASPTTKATVQRRWWLSLSTAPIPGDPELAPSPDSMSLYVGTTSSALHRVATPAVGATVAVLGDAALDNLTGAAPPTSGNFPDGDPALFESAATGSTGSPLVDLRGDGTAKLPRLIQSGTVMVSGTGTLTATITFPEPFTAPPRVTANAADFVTNASRAFVRAVDQVTATTARVVVIDLAASPQAISNLPITWTATAA